MTTDSDFGEHVSRELKGHKKRVLTVSWSHNGKRLATGGFDNVVKIWRIEPRASSKVERAESELAGLTGHVTQIDWDPANVDRLFSVGDKTLRIWDTRSSRCLHTAKLTREILHAAWRPDGAEILILDRTDTLTVIDSSTFKVSRAYKYEQEINEIAFSADGQLVYVARTDGSFDVVQYSTFKKVRTVHLHTNSMLRVKNAPNGRLLATGGTDAAVCLVDVAQLICSHTLVGFDNTVSQLSFSSDSRWIAFSEENSAGIYIASVSTGKLVHKVETKHPVEALSWNPKHPVLAFNSASGMDRDGTSYCYIGILAGPEKPTKVVALARPG